MRRFLFAVILLAVVVPASAQDFLKPEAWDDYYDMACRQKLLPDYTNVFYMCRPSFSPEYALSIEQNPNDRQDKQLVFKRAKENIWYHDRYYKYPRWHGRWRLGRHKVGVQSYELKVSDEAITLISNLIKAANETASYFNGEMDGCDGVIYYFHSWPKYGSVWSPHGRTRRLVAVMDSLCLAVEQGDIAMVYRQMPACRTLLQEFRQDYPMAAFTGNFYYSCADTACANVESVGRYTEHLSFKCFFSNPLPMETAREWCADMSDRVAQLARQLFLMQDSLYWRLNVCIEEGQPDEYYFDQHMHYIIRLSDTTDMANKCLSAPLRQEGLYRLEDGSWQQVDTAGAVRWWDKWFF